MSWCTETSVFVFELSQNASGFQSFLSVDFGHQKYTRSACASSNASLFYLSISNLSVR